MRASGETQVISPKMSPAPPSARAPRWTIWKSLISPSVAEYMAIGETTMRFGKVRSRMRNGVSMGGVVRPLPTVSPQDCANQRS